MSAISKLWQKLRRMRRKPAKKEKFALALLYAVFLRILSAGFLTAVVCAAIITAANMYVTGEVKDYILSPDEASASDADCIMVLGAGVSDDGQPRLLLRDRLNTGIELYKRGASDRLLMTGDHGRVGYDEVNAMKNYAADAGIERNAIFMDHAGFSTYESMYRARDVFSVRSVVIVTQRYHLYRAVYDARSLGLDARGVACDPGPYHGQIWLDAREVLARCKDWVWCIFRPKPTYLGDVIPISGSGEATAG